jgi:hypothetical protein
MPAARVGASGAWATTTFVDPLEGCLEYADVGRVRRVLVLTLAALACLPAAAAQAEDPLFVGWTGLLPAITVPYVPTSEDDCVAGRTQCVDKVIKAMQKRFAPLAASCDHDAVFSLSYLRTTQEYRRTIEDPHFFEDTAYVNHEDAVFAEYYFRAYDDWHAGRRSAVPGAWREALAAADGKEMSGSGDLFLGMHAHIRRDLPFVLAGIGITAPDGTSRKPDHDKVDVFLNRVTEPLLAEIAARFDPAADDRDVPGTQLDTTALFQVVAAWREEAWRNAEALVAAPAALRPLVAQGIEDRATAAAKVLRASMRADSGPRDAWCAAHAG